MLLLHLLVGWCLGCFVVWSVDAWVGALFGRFVPWLVYYLMHFMVHCFLRWLVRCFCQTTILIFGPFWLLFLLSFVVFSVGVYICWCFGMRCFFNNLNISFFSWCLDVWHGIIIVAFTLVSVMFIAGVIRWLISMF